MRSVVLATPLAILLVLANSGDVDARFGSALRVFEHVQIKATWSPDRTTCSIIFDDLAAEVRPFGASNVDVETVSLATPIQEVKGKSVSLDIRGHVAIDSNSRAVLLIQAGGETRTFRWDASTEAGEFAESFDSNLPSASDYLVTIFLLVERDTARSEAEAGLTLDTLNLVIDG